MSYGLNTSDSSQEFLDSWFYYQRLVILLLYTVFSVLSSCISIKLKPNYCKYWNGTSGEKNLGVYFGRRVLKEFLDERISKKKRKFRGLYWIFPARLSRANYTGCWLLLISLIKTCFSVLLSYRNEVGLWDFILPQNFYWVLSSWLLCLLMIVLYIKVSFQSFYFVNFQWLQDSHTTFPPFKEQWPSGSGAGFPKQGSHVQTY